MLDFPASPTLGQFYTSGTVSWQWDGAKWIALRDPDEMQPWAIPILTANPTVAPGVGWMWLYGFDNGDGTTTLRLQRGTSTVAYDLIVDIGIDE